MASIKEKLTSIEQIPSFVYLCKWLVIAALIGALAGSASAALLYSLEWATNYREANKWIIALLPIGGLIVGLVYHYYGSSVVKGNNQLLEEFHSPHKIIPFRMAPLVLFGTVMTHLFGGSAGREGSAVQMGGAIADQFTKWFKLKKEDRKIVIIIGVSAGFASVFGTPLAGAIFALEVMILGRMRYDALLASVLGGIIADYVCKLWPVHHTHYGVELVPEITPTTLFYAIIAGLIFGLGGLAFSKATHFFTIVFKKLNYPPLRPFIGGAVVALAVYLIGTTKYIGLGVPTIVDAFNMELPWYDFAAKLLFTAFTLGAGFKGGEVTPLFYIGATLGNALIWFVPLPTELLAGMGFVAVFAAATNTPIACTIMAIELFGGEGAVYFGVACVVAYMFSGHSGIYSSQIVGSPKHFLFGVDKGKTLAAIDSFRKKKSS
ncbi:voltage-gated chloride channel family protein [Neptunitalea lumnitzerae]|uniref:Voltage-gated chloride channel membrane protein n=1 Tax=Neptunitalea lumnitzerae TaxID=2965509 RepID=A0ABQ5MFU0_9FLAO|nr:voltage-gated chloride channel family protein [Neptunitalea sp. Y10]GLB48286.1 voltage-gated chloride channel membrane protein [Neptunitalea sp. Y10]